MPHHFWMLYFVFNTDQINNRMLLGIDGQLDLALCCKVASLLRVGPGWTWLDLAGPGSKKLLGLLRFIGLDRSLIGSEALPHRGELDHGEGAGGQFVIAGRRGESAFGWSRGSGQDAVTVETLAEARLPLRLVLGEMLSVALWSWVGSRMRPASYSFAALLMGADAGAIDRLYVAVVPNGNSVHQPVLDASHATVVAGSERRIVLRQTVSRRAGAQHLEDAGQNCRQ